MKNERNRSQYDRWKRNATYSINRFRQWKAYYILNENNWSVNDLTYVISAALIQQSNILVYSVNLLFFGRTLLWWVFLNISGDLYIIQIMYFCQCIAARVWKSWMYFVFKFELIFFRYIRSVPLLVQSMKHFYKASWHNQIWLYSPFVLKPQVM